jgi:hypothetical protein
VDIRNSNFYYISIDRYSPKLPAHSSFVRTIELVGPNRDRQAVVIDTGRQPETFPPRYLLIIPRERSINLFDLNVGSLATLYVFDAEGLLSHDQVQLDLPETTSPIDIGAITGSLATAKRYQVTASAVKASDEYMRKHFGPD